MKARSNFYDPQSYLFFIRLWYILDLINMLELTSLLQTQGFQLCYWAKFHSLLWYYKIMRLFSHSLGLTGISRIWSKHPSSKTAILMGTEKAKFKNIVFSYFSLFSLKWLFISMGESNTVVSASPIELYSYLFFKKNVDSWSLDLDSLPLHMDCIPE